MEEPDNYFHKVLAKDMEAFDQKRIMIVKAECGKTWTPSWEIEGKTPCPICFSPMVLKYSNVS